MDIRCIFWDVIWTAKVLWLIFISVFLYKLFSVLLFFLHVCYIKLYQLNSKVLRLMWVKSSKIQFAFCIALAKLFSILCFINFFSFKLHVSSFSIQFYCNCSYPIFITSHPNHNLVISIQTFLGEVIMWLLKSYLEIKHNINILFSTFSTMSQTLPKEKL